MISESAFNALTGQNRPAYPDKRRIRCRLAAAIYVLTVVPVLFFSGSSLPACAAVPPFRIETAGAVFLCDAPLRNSLKQVAAIYPDVKKALEAVIGWEVDFRPVILLVDHPHFQEMAGTPFIAAFAVASENLVVLDHSRMNVRSMSLEITLRHELCHLLLRRYIEADRLPRWFNEGVAQWSSDGISELLIARRENHLQAAVLSGNLVSLDQLSRTFPRDPDGLLLAYEESRSMVTYIVRQYGKAGILSILQYMRAGDTVEDAVLKALAIPFRQLEMQWHDHLRKTGSWLIWVAVNLYEIIFLLAALVTAAGGIRRLLKNRQLPGAPEDEDDDDDPEMREQTEDTGSDVPG